MKTKTITEMHTDNIKTAHQVFKKYGIYFCCGGSVSIKRVAEKEKVNYLDLEKIC